MKGGIADVMKHKWYGSFDWKGLLNGTIAPPYVPDLSHVNTTEPLDADDDADDEAEMVSNCLFLLHFKFCFVHRRRVTGWLSSRKEIENVCVPV